MQRIVCVLLSIATAQATGDDEPPFREAVVQAPVLTDIKLDGKLDDWPPAMPRHAIFNLLPDGAASWEGTDFSTSPDLSCAFMVGYDPKPQLLLVAVIVRDDKLIVGNASSDDTDAVEVYVDGLRSERTYQYQGGPNLLWFENADLAELPVQQYCAIPGKGKVYGASQEANPLLIAGDLKKTKTRMAFTRVEDVTTYEWTIQVFDQYPDQPTKLAPGKRIGFDVVVVDKDVPLKDGDPPEAGTDRRSWIYWGPNWRGTKTFNAGNLGEIVLGE